MAEMAGVPHSQALIEYHGRHLKDSILQHLKQYCRQSGPLSAKHSLEVCMLLADYFLPEWTRGFWQALSPQEQRLFEGLVELQKGRPEAA
jgi:hypothetical protein